MVSTVTWTSFAMPLTLVNVGTEAVCILCDNILCFTDLKTKAISYYKAESPELGLSISAMCGHNRFALVAFAEVVLRPSVHIIQYPDFNKYAVFTTSKIISFVDIRFNEYDLLIALSGYPNYTLCIWNFRTGLLLIQHDTMHSSLSRSLQCSYHHIPQIVQFSKWNNQIFLWELCYSSTGADLHEVAKISLTNEFTLSDIMSMCYGEDNNLYVVDNFGNVSMIEASQFNIKPQWSITSPEEIQTSYRHFNICSHKQGLLIHCKEMVYYLRKKQLKWHCEWKVTQASLNPRGDLKKLLSNGNGEIYGSADIGNLYHLEVLSDSVTLNALNDFYENSIDFVVLKGIKEECLIQLTTNSTLQAVAMARMNIYSRFEIPNAQTIVAHNVGPYVMVGTTTGKLHFLNYSNIRAPLEMATITTNSGYPVGSVKLMDQMAVYRTIYFKFYLVKADFSTGSFYEIAPFENISENVGVCQYFLTGDSRVFMFINRDSPLLLPHTTELWSYEWVQDKRKIERREYQLPHTYRDVSGGTAIKNIVELYAIRLENNVIDLLNFHIDSNELVLTHTIQTNHLSNINGIVGSQNLLTWGLDGTYIHFRSHNKSSKAYGICQMLQIKYRPRVVKKVLDCFNAKYLVYMYSQGGLKIMKVSPTAVSTIENSYRTDSPNVIESHSYIERPLEQMDAEVVVEHAPHEIQRRENLLKNVKDLEKEMTALINYDMSVTGQSQGIFKKFCLHHKWLVKLTAESRKLCEAERNSLEAAINDQLRIRDWLYALITSTNSGISFKIRAIFSNFSLENYGMRKSNDTFSQLYELYHFYDMEYDENKEEAEELEGENKENMEYQMGEKTQQLKREYFSIQGSAYDHIMSNDLAMQEINIVTANQMYNQDAKIRILLTDRLKVDFNKRFVEIGKIKSELMEAILATNTTLTNIYENMNCMLGLLGREPFQPPPLSVPQWQKDEFVKSIMEVDDSEIKAVNRRKKKPEIQAAKHGRMLLWSFEFWFNALVTMMDGVLEKLWEDEIKKEIPVPEFLNKKEPTEYSLEDQKVLRKYEEDCRVLQEERMKYLGILTENDGKTSELKAKYILQLNANVTEMMILKLKYDFAIKHIRLRNLNTKLMYFKKLQWLTTINKLRADIELTNDYIQKYSKLSEFWAKSVEDLRLKVDNLMLKEKSTERQFKAQFLNSIPQHLGPEMTKMFKRRPKTSPKLLYSTLICKELSMRVNTKTQPKYPFPLPKDINEYLDALNTLDDPTNMPVSLESKYWDHFTKLRRQKVELELKVRAVNLQLADGTCGMNTYVKELAGLKSGRSEAVRKLQEAQEEYLKSVQNQSLELRLTMGQVELNVKGSLKNLENCILMHEDDINDINALILKAGQMKLKAMQRVAFFRRQVIYQEWEHKVVGANIEYLKNMLYVIGKCKVSIEFLNILRNWQKIRANKPKVLNTEGIIERVSGEKLMSFRRQLMRINDKTSKVRQQIDEMKQGNKRINRQIEELKVAVAFSTTNRDFMIEEKKRREQNEKMEKIKKHRILIETVRRDYAHILELKTILELQRLRTYPTLGPNPDHC